MIELVGQALSRIVEEHTASQVVGITCLARRWSPAPDLAGVGDHVRGAGANDGVEDSSRTATSWSLRSTRTRLAAR